MEIPIWMELNKVEHNIPGTRTAVHLSKLKQHLHYFKEPWKRSNVCVYIDNILVTGTDEQNHMNDLELVLQRLELTGLTLKKSKCVFTAVSVGYLGHVIDKNGLHLSSSKVQAIKEQAPSPTNVTELKSFLGLVNYYHKFLPNLSTSLAPLHPCHGYDIIFQQLHETHPGVSKMKNLARSYIW